MNLIAGNVQSASTAEFPSKGMRLFPFSREFHLHQASLIDNPLLYRGGGEI